MWEPIGSGQARIPELGGGKKSEGEERKDFQRAHKVGELRSAL